MSGTQRETAWLIEHAKNGVYVTGLRVLPGGSIGFTIGTDPNYAWRFARRQDAEEVLHVYDIERRGWTATEHSWVTDWPPKEADIA